MFDDEPEPGKEEARHGAGAYRGKLLHLFSMMHCFACLHLQRHEEVHDHSLTEEARQARCARCRRVGRAGRQGHCCQCAAQQTQHDAALCLLPDAGDASFACTSERGTGTSQLRREEACAICARLGFLETRIRVCLWRTPESVGEGAALEEEDSIGGGGRERPACRWRLPGQMLAPGDI